MELLQAVAGGRSYWVYGEMLQDVSQCRIGGLAAKHDATKRAITTTGNRQMILLARARRVRFCYGAIVVLARLLPGTAPLLCSTMSLLTITPWGAYHG